MAGFVTRTRIRAAIGLIAAYAIALQALFAAFAPLPVNASGVDFTQVICFGSGNASAPAGDDSNAPAPASAKFHCVLCVSQAAAAILPEPETGVPARSAIAAIFAPATVDFLLAPAPARAGPSRAPPLTV